MLPLVSKVFEKSMHDQLCEYIEKFLNQVQCGFHKALSTQLSLPSPLLLREWLKGFDSGRFIGTVLMDLPKVYDCLRHDLLIAKLKYN